MPRFRAAVTTTLTTATAGAVLGGWKVGGQTAKMVEIKIFNLTAPTTSGHVGFCRSTVDGSGTLTSNAAIAHDQRSSSTAIAWSNYGTALPTVGAVGTAFERWDHSTGLGSGTVIPFDLTERFEVTTTAATGHICLINLQAIAAATYSLTFVWDE